MDHDSRLRRPMTTHLAVNKNHSHLRSSPMAPDLRRNPVPVAIGHRRTTGVAGDIFADLMGLPIYCVRTVESL